MLKQRVIYVLFIVLLNVMSSSVSASCKTIDDLRPNADGTVTDRRKGTIWKMCPEGMAWNGRACVGTEIRLNWYDSIKHASNARDIGKSDWRLPTTLDVQDLVVNKKKCLDQHPDADKFATPPFLAHIPVVAPAFDMDMWLSNTEPTSQTAAMTFNIYVGLIGTNGKSNAKRAIRLVRSGSDLAASLAKSEFVRMNEDQQANETEAQGRRQTRQIGQLCEAQKNTCIASCPVDRYSDGSVMGPEYSCRRRCESISCD